MSTALCARKSKPGELVIRVSYGHACDEPFRLRHQVYCEEYGFESSTGSGLESDGFDRDAFHISVENNLGEAVACVRLVPTRRDAENIPMYSEIVESYDSHNAEYFRKIAEGAIAVESFSALTPGRNSAEVSRFCIPREFQGDRKLLLTLVQAVSALAQELDIERLVMFCDSRLLIHLRRAFKINHDPLFERVWFHDRWRTPAVMAPDTFPESIKTPSPPLVMEK